MLLIQFIIVEPEPIAIVGMACRVPQAKNVNQFWNNLVNGVDSITKVRLSIFDELLLILTF